MGFVKSDSNHNSGSDHNSVKPFKPHEGSNSISGLNPKNDSNHLISRTISVVRTLTPVQTITAAWVLSALRTTNNGSKHKSNLNHKRLSTHTIELPAVNVLGGRTTAGECVLSKAESEVVDRGGSAGRADRGIVSVLYNVSSILLAALLWKPRKTIALILLKSCQVNVFSSFLPLKRTHFAKSLGNIPTKLYEHYIRFDRKYLLWSHGVRRGSTLFGKVHEGLQGDFEIARWRNWIGGRREEWDRKEEKRRKKNKKEKRHKKEHRENKKEEEEES